MKTAAIETAEIEECLYFIILAKFTGKSPLCKKPGGSGRNADAACVNAALPVDYLGFAVMRPDGVLL